MTQEKRKTMKEEIKRKVKQNKMLIANLEDNETAL